MTEYPTYIHTTDKMQIYIIIYRILPRQETSLLKATLKLIKHTDFQNKLLSMYFLFYAI